MKISAREFFDGVLDPGSYRSWDREPIEIATAPAYHAELTAAAERSGTDESVLTGEGRLRGRRVAVIACEFGFLAGSIGVAAAERIVTAVERATALGLPLLASPTSGGTRMQEGTVAFVQMVKIAGAVAAHKSAGHPYLVYLRDPTMGGVFASWGSLGHMTFAEPGALIGFLGPRVYEALYDRPFPEGVQTAENLYRNGVIDGVVPVRFFRRIAHRVLNVAVPVAGQANSLSIASTAQGVGRVGSPGAEGVETPAWESVLISRDPRRPGIRELLRQASDRVPLSGTGQGESDRAVVHALARLRGEPCVIFGHDRAGRTGENTMGPAALREARRSMHLAAELHIPLVLVIDTAGAALSREAEERGLAPEIARCLADLVTLDTPTVSVLLGQGTGGGALALLPADRVLAATHGWLAPLPPEGASAIVFRDTAHAAELAAAQRVRAADLLADGVVDRIVAEHPDAAREPIDFSRRMVAAIAEELAALRARPTAALRASRRNRYRRLGVPG
ncbi:carboxyl transferase domain-containing protein [Nocardia cerradoensis]|uniref:Putative acetyl-coenzyme A carboxylase carboxyl transferase subunit beta n=1 Tax=Nocardia cerradoensis TaxID=85688 RepID=A0A231H7D1_9NOCA|nr:carboxyl transferase domain-containing protein [Nocardia cerradoensis]NKY47302.1 acetyl-CoA carboxyl transferase [Nocardia cerradoensis]OXR44690.1 putative acetyl-coenzyme A carboxylase carboxyl transferase subunit beta [Nocardia cerradoensis]